MLKKTTLIIFILLLVIAAVVMFTNLATQDKTQQVKAVNTSNTANTANTTTAVTSTAKTINHPLGNTGNCRKVPTFIRGLGMRAPALDSTQTDERAGLKIRDYSQKDKTWQHPSWQKSGYIGAFERDDKGNIYVNPLPYVSLKDNPPEIQNRLYSIDAKSAEMRLFMTLPSMEKPNAKNPFGVMGLYFDCDTKSLYVSSVAGSTPRQEKGVIFQIDPATKEILSKLENIDTVGLGVFNTSNGKRLYFGSARDSSLYSIGLDQKGAFKNDKRYEFSLSQLEGGDTTIIKKIKFKKRDEKLTMTLQEMEFGYRLLAENRAFQKKYHFEFNESENKWLFKGISKR